MKIFETDYSFENDELAATRTKLLIALLLFFIFNLSVFAIIRFSSGNILGGVADLVGLLIVSWLLNRLKTRSDYYVFTSRLLLAVTLIVIFTTTYLEHAFSRGIAWSLAAIIFAFYLRDRKEGLIWSLLMLAIVTVSYFTVVKKIVLFDYLSFLFSILTVSMVIYAYEHIKEKAQKSRIKQEEQEFLKNVIDSAVDPIMVIDRDYNVTMHNDAVEKQIDWSCIADRENLKCYEISHHRSTPCDGTDHPCPLREVLETQEHASALHIHQDKRGVSQYVELSASPHRDGKGDIVGIIEIARDITDRIEVENQLEVEQVKLTHLANHDPLTNLPNRLLFHDRVEQAIKRSQRNFSQFVVFFINLDRFKAINDSLGHIVGDKVLQEVTARLKYNMREADTIARLGGDEFALIIESTQHLEDVRNLAEKVQSVLSESMMIAGHELYVTSSIGISLFPNDGDAPEMLFRHADTAVHRAKEEGKNNYCFYTSDMTEQAFERVLMESSLRRALENDEFRVFYQPQIDAATQKLIGKEALVRWEHPELGLVGPDKFLTIAEESGLITEIDHWVMLHACRQQNEWHKRGINPGNLALNLSMKQLHQEDLLAHIQKLITESGCVSHHLEMEITESQIMHKPEQVIRVLNQISDLGISVAVDDFGTGYSSLAYLKRLPVNKLKIDQSFVRDLPDDEEDIAITRAIVALAKSLKLKVIAEGVENEEQKEFLLREGCSNIQGYLYGKPMPADEFEGYLKQQEE